jgi:two-component system, OmpR family, sensor histidine kinase MtrB
MTAAALAGWVVALAGLLGCAAMAARLRGQSVRVARAAHELRGGLSVALLALDAVAVDAARLQLARADRALAELDRAAAAGDELLDFAALLRDLAAAWEAVRLSLGSAPLTVRGDRAALAQAASNLVANALEHGAPPVLVRARRAGGWVRLEVSDGGGGLGAPVDALVAAARGRSGPRGHGLVVAADVAERHGGRIGSAPAPAGATVVLELPAHRADA